jgi:hypothetical protein
VLQKGNENTVVMTTEPASERGQILLMRKPGPLDLPTCRLPAGAYPALAAIDGCGGER